MEYRTLSGTGARVSRLCLGTMTFGGQADEAASIRMVHHAIDAGVNFIDAADIYTKGASETILGKALQGRRDGIVLLSKVGNRSGQYELKDHGLSRWHIIHGVEASLKRLRTDCLDILLFHRPDYSTPLEESLAAADVLVRQGKIMYYGMSNYAAWQLCQAKWLAERHRYAPPVLTQTVYNLLARGIEQELIPFCRNMSMGLMVYNPLAGGLLTGKHATTTAPAEGTRFQLNQEYYGRYWRDSNIQAVAELAKIAEQAGRSLIQLSFQWLAAQQEVDSIILGVSRMEQLEENLAAVDGTVDQDTMAACDRVWAEISGDRFAYNR